MMKINKCTRCILPSTYPAIKFDQDGICNYCHFYEKKKYLGESQLMDILESYRNMKGEYDAVVGVSGGRDSSYALYYLVKKAKLRVLAYSIDNGLVTEQAKLNMQNMADILGVKLIIEKNDMTRRCLKHNIKSWIRHPSPGMILLTCTICNAGIESGLLKTAKKHKIPLIVTGAGGIETEGFKGVLVGVKPENKKTTSFSVAFKMLWELILNPFYLLCPVCLAAEIKAFSYMYLPFPLIQKLIFPKQRIVKFFDYVEDNESLVYSTIQNELNWQKSADVESGWRIDCLLSHLKNYLYYEIFGFSEKDDIYSNMIRQGVMNRESAVKRIDKENVIPTKIIADLCNEIGIDMNDLIAAATKLKKK